MLKILIIIFVAIIWHTHAETVNMNNKDDGSLYEIYALGNSKSYRYQYKVEDEEKQSLPPDEANNDNDVDADFSQTYQYSYELEDGQKQFQMGYFKHADANNLRVWVVEGDYSFIAPDGKSYTVEYIADENGYRTKNKYFTYAGQPFAGPEMTTRRPPPPPQPPPLRPPPPITRRFPNFLISAVGGASRGSG